MQVHVRLFAGLKERAGAASLELELPDGARVADALEQLEWLTAGSAVMAINREYADADTPLHPGDELALIPPVSGGGDGPAHLPARVHVRVTPEALSLDDVTAQVSDPRAGGIVTFQGVTREVPQLEYEAYSEMAAAQLRQIAEQAVKRHGLCAAAIEHRIGTVPLSQPSVIVAASAPHRAEAFAGARELIDELKARAPIWKREEGEWVSGSLPPAGAATPPQQAPQPPSSGGESADR
jgi:molybdopterin synthase catalytic subunit